MKKKYINPEMEVIIMKSECSLLAGSDPEAQIQNLLLEEGWGD